MIKFMDFGDCTELVSHHAIQDIQKDKLDMWRAKYEGATKKPSLKVCTDFRPLFVDVKSNDFPELPSILLEITPLYKKDVLAVSIYPLLGNNISKIMNLDIFIELFNDGIIDGIKSRKILIEGSFKKIHDPFIVVSDEGNNEPYMNKQYCDFIDQYNSCDKGYIIAFKLSPYAENVYTVYDYSKNEKRCLFDTDFDTFLYDSFTNAYTMYEELKATHAYNNYYLDIVSVIKTESGQYQPSKWMGIDLRWKE